MEPEEYESYFPSTFPFQHITGTFIVFFAFEYMNVRDFVTDSVWEWRNFTPILDKAGIENVDMSGNPYGLSK